MFIFSYLKHLDLNLGGGKRVSHGTKWVYSVMNLHDAQLMEQNSKK